MPNPPPKTPSPPAGPDSVQASYDEIAYDSRPVPASHIELLAVEATVGGVTPALIERCRVLELGCASGGNLLPMADEFPESQFVGIDLSPKQIAEAKRVATAAGLKNVKLGAANLMNIGGKLGQFDYIICHGVYSWVPPTVADKVLDIFGELLAPNGVGYLSYNTYPGWHARQMVRDMLLRHTRGAKGLREVMSRALELLKARAATDAGAGHAFATVIRNEARMELALGESYIAHEPLEENLYPVYFETLVERLAARGLTYVADLRPNPVRRRDRKSVV